MTPHNADANLLFGVLALQMDFISRDQLIAGMQAWVNDKAQPLAMHLVRASALTPEDRSALEPLIAAHVRRHGSDPQQSLAAISSVDSLRRDLNGEARLPHTTTAHQRDDPAPLQVADNRPVALIAPKSPVVDPDNLQSRGIWAGPPAHDPQKRVVADRQHQALREARPGSAAQRQTEMMDDALQPDSPS